jgi:general secretion pathway protein G
MRKNQSGFTLLEIMLVVTIIALLMAAAIYKMGPGNVAYARHTKIQGDIQTIGTQLSLYENMNGFRPTTDQGLKRW